MAIYLIDRLTRLENEADREQFLRGVLGVDKFNAKSFAGGLIAGGLAAKIITRSK